MSVRNTPWKLALACAVLGLTAHAHGQMALQTLRSFGVPGQSAASPRAPLVQGPDGALYGTTPFGIPGSTNWDYQSASFGTVFKINSDGTGFSILHYFVPDSTNGFSPKDGLLVGSDGILYGTTEGDPSGWITIGTVFRLNPDGTGFETLYTFDYPEQGPCAGLIQGQDGTLYGLTAGGEGRPLQAQPGRNWIHRGAYLQRRGLSLRGYWLRTPPAFSTAPRREESCSRSTPMVLGLPWCST